MRTMLISEKLDLKALGERVLNARLGPGKAEAAIDTLKRLNPHLDLDKLQPGTVVFVPDAPGFKPSASVSSEAEVFDDFRKLVTDGLAQAEAGLKAGIGRRADERKETAAGIKAARRIVANDPEVLKQLDLADEALARDKELDTEEVAEFEATAKAIAAAVEQLGKLV
ncbi:MAG TPA: hypothetical protein VGV07_22255 [Devosia sp.]|jgi:predicted DNA-binding protein (UPF0251 family)|uniref:hypothetical protein n=1 Tax=Devosia sp. TaxID=1871048 RepID=UPI002DDD96E8|nr:hypothetical protein [Devosia sp.]HEV2517991.1 hypothetical protein [Devosia sp.]